MLHFLRTYGSWQSALIHIALFVTVGALFLMTDAKVKFGPSNVLPRLWYVLALMLLALALSAIFAGICRQIAFELLA